MHVVRRALALLRGEAGGNEIVDAVASFPVRDGCDARQTLLLGLVRVDELRALPLRAAVPGAHGEAIFVTSEQMLHFLRVLSDGIGAVAARNVGG